MSELDELIEDLRKSAAAWFNDNELLKLERLFSIAREALKGVDLARTEGQTASPGERL